MTAGSNSDEKVIQLSVKQLFASSGYVIPVYQRNYAWGSVEIEQLLQDVRACLEDNEEGVTTERYFIGSLVVARRDDNTYEVIDGQQRHTTLSILLACLKHLGCKIDVARSNLHFESRPASQGTLERLFLSADQSDSEYAADAAMYAAFKTITRELNGWSEDSLQLFSDFLLDKVKILRVVVPEGTNLNHYFEIMNNRGEQLEKHEVLKARMMSSLQSEGDRHCFAKAWDACADMDGYVQMNITSNTQERTSVFGNDWNALPENWPMLRKSIECHAREAEGNGGASDNFPTLENLLAPPHKDERVVPEKGHRESESAYSSIIGFPNFLLLVLRVHLANQGNKRAADAVKLDDKHLLAMFDKYLGKSENKVNDDSLAAQRAKSFLVSLLTCRLLFDRYVIKRKGDKEWSLEQCNSGKVKSTPSVDYRKTFKGDDNKQLEMILSMFHVSFPTQTNKYWLAGTLEYLVEKSPNGVDAQVCLAYLEGLCDKIFYGRFGHGDEEGKVAEYRDIIRDSQDQSPAKGSFNRENIRKATNISNFIFNRLDYQLWKMLKDDEKEWLEQEQFKYLKERQKNFAFSFRSSVEHYFPRKPQGEGEINTNQDGHPDVDRFGNLCLISASQNSKLSNYSPKAKKEHYEKSSVIESLKQIVMMSYPEWAPDDEHREGGRLKEIVEHERQMLEILEKPLTEAFNYSRSTGQGQVA